MDEWNLNSPSRIRPESGKTVGDDLCGPIPKDVRPPGLQVPLFVLSIIIIIISIAVTNCLYCYELSFQM